ncbi:MAG: TspO/MBR family protein [Pseudomonadota bacterium]
MSAPAWKPILVGALAALAVGTIGGSLTVLGPWYQGLVKPDWQPPDWLFGPAWTIIFALAALSAARAWLDAGADRRRQWIIGLFVLNGFLNVFWSLLFFRVQRPDWSGIEVLLLWLSILVLIIFIGRFSRPAALLLIPYLLWVSFAAALNWAVVGLNAPFGAA